ncbi:GMP synthase [Pedobacter sp. UBA4863]|uniref:type 1 glutamine amidotransferase n=1 Tax=Pedobacter sp. UBA4863 TaxID=1947060 RepID=UPI0025ED60FA|nr:GMP synthase [Pedobacter sp. UBA4863]
MNNINTFKVAVIDMNNGFPNQGLRGILEILHRYKTYNQLNLSVTIFDIRQKGEVPDLSYHIYISSGGPGSPHESEGQQWERNFFNLLDSIDDFNLVNNHKKYVFLICHSFQLACIKYNLGQVTQRKSNSFGIFPISLTEQGENEPIFRNLPNPFFAVDSRDWQVIMPNQSAFDKMGAKLLAIEKERPHVDLERCMMAIRFSPYVAGTQFHPEADPVGMKTYLSLEEKKNIIIKNYGEEKYHDMIDSLENPKRIMITQSIILPNFLDEAIHALQAV